MNSSLEVQRHMFPNIGSSMPNSMELYWESMGGIGESSIAASKRGEPVETTSSYGKKDISKVKNSAALKTHCEAERRRRERINGHFATLRNFLSCTDKMDKATLLAEVITQVKILKEQAVEATKGMLIPMDADEVNVEPYNDDVIEDDSFMFKVSICCRYKPELIPDIRQAIHGLKLSITKAEISTLDGRVKHVLVVSGSRESIGDEQREGFTNSLNEALRTVLEKISASEECSPLTTLHNKRRRVSCFESSTWCPSL